MRLSLSLLAATFLSACSTKPVEITAPNPETLPQATLTPEQDLNLPPRETPPAVVKKEPPQTVLKTQLLNLSPNGIDLHLFVCDDRNVRFSIADKEHGPESGWSNAEVAGRREKSLACINGGFFTPEGTPLGLVIESGRRFGNWNGSSSLTSGVFLVQGDTPRIVRSNKSNPSQSADYLIQTGPFLVEKGKVVTGLSNDRKRPRSFLLWDGSHHWAFGYASNATLSGLSRALAKQPVPGMSIKTALNLDGGTSSQLWVGKSVKGGPRFHRPLLRKDVRNFILAHDSP